jgi:hypothetical protein
MTAQWERSKSHLEAAVNSSQEALQAEQIVGKRTSHLLDEERQRSQQMSDHYQNLLNEKQGELDNVFLLHSKEIRFNEELLSKQRQLEGEKEDLIREQSTSKENYDKMYSRISSMEHQQATKLLEYQQLQQDLQQKLQHIQDLEEDIKDLQKDIDLMRDTHVRRDCLDFVRISYFFIATTDFIEG